MYQLNSRAPADVRISRHLALSLLMAAGLAAVGSRAAFAGAVIYDSADPAFRTVKLGVNDLGHLNYDGGDGVTGLAARFPDGNFFDAISPGCLCEGWGLAVTVNGSRVSGFANESTGTGGLTGGTFGSTLTSATSVVSLADAPVRITHSYGVSLAPGVFQSNITITNLSDTAISDVVYRRVMDWDVPPTEFREYVTHKGVAANLEALGGNVRFASNNGFANADPLSGPSSIDASTENADFTDLGPNDHGSLFDFAFGNLAAGGSRSFNIFYGVAANETAAENAIQILKPNLWSLGQSTLGLGGDGGGDIGCEPECPSVASAVAEFPPPIIGEPTEGPTDVIPPEAVGLPSPNNDGFTFIFAFGGVGGVEPGASPANPVLPFVPAPGQFAFPAPAPRRWYDPPFAEGFDYSLENGEFLAVAIPEGYGSLTLQVGSFTAKLDPLREYNFLTDFGLDDVTSFRILGIAPYLDVASPTFATAFPTFLDFVTTGELRMKAVEVAAVPVPAALPLLASGLTFLVGWRRRAARA